jgi:hypothetical protein
MRLENSYATGFIGGKPETSRRRFEMDIWVENRFKDFFAWQFSERELKLPGHKLMVEQIKADFKHGTERMFFREETCWLIHKSRFADFFDLYFQFVKDYALAQGEMNL